MLRTIVYIHRDDEDDDVGHHEGGDQPWEPALEEAEVTIAHGGGARR